MNSPQDRPRVLTGDTPTGALHLGHYVGSLEARLAMQEDHDCFFLVANVHALTTRPTEVEGIRADTIAIVKDWLAVGLDPQKATFFLQSEVPAIAELTWYFSMLLGYGRLMKNPTIKDEIRVKNLGENYSFGFLLYPVGQIADILAFKPAFVPVGEDQIPHIEMTREIARRFNQVYCGIKGGVPDEQHLEKGGVFPIPDYKLGRVSRLTGIDGVNKMSKSLNNAIFLSDTAKQVQKKCNKIFTGRGSLDDPPVLEGNTVFEYHATFNPDKDRVAELRERYAAGKVGDGQVKKELGEVINAFLDPIRERRAELTEADVIDVLRTGTARANEAAEATLHQAKQAMKYDFFARDLKLR
ncbi:MAG: tryptophan--tRNA ligase [Phycisphaeraceae bacterium]